MAITSEQALSILEDTAQLLQKTQRNLKKCPKERLTKGYIETRIKCLDEYWGTFKQAHQDLLKCTTREQRGILTYFVNEEYYLHEDLYFTIQAELKDMLSMRIKTSEKLEQTEIQNAGSSNCTNRYISARLPSIQLPTFSGNYEEWPTYQDLFISLVHQDSSLTQVQKLHYLKTSISGEAAHLLKHLQITETNYVVAWATLKNRYGNKRLIVNSLLKRLFSQRKLNIQSSLQVKTLLDTTTECINSLQNLNITTDSWDPIIIFLVVQKLDPESHKQWEEYAYRDNSEELPMWEDLKKFLESKFRTLELVMPGPAAREKVVKERVFHVATAKICIKCKENHTLSHCSDFAKLPPVERSSYVKNNKICFNCLTPGHSAVKCRAPFTCRVCNKRHHSLLHQARRTGTVEDNHPKPMQSTVSTSSVEEVQVNTRLAAQNSCETQIALLATALVTIQNDKGHTNVVKALVDKGSQASFISEKAAHMLKLKRYPVNKVVTGMESMKMVIKQIVKLRVLSRWEPTCYVDIQAYVMSKHLTTFVPVQLSEMLSTNKWPHLTGLQLADPGYFESGSIDLLLGVKEYANILQEGLIKGPPGTPCAQRTSLGWIVFGEMNVDNKTKDRISAMHHQLKVQEDVDVHELLKAIWEIDTETKRRYTKDEQMCEEIYESTHTRNKEGRYIVKLPFKTKNLKAPEGNSKDIALHRLIQLEQRFKRMPKLKEEYTRVIEEYKYLKHMEEIPEKEINIKKSLYLPHHAVIRDNKETTKTRVVFDASCKGYNGVSLNDELLTGPVLQDDLRNLIMRWRTYKICFVSDIEKMYRMILINKEDTEYQRILWRNDPSETIKEFRLLTVTFGTASAPYLAVRTLLQLADDEGEKYPEAAKILREDFYMDDVMSGCDTVNQAIKISKDLKDLLRLGGFELKKWSSNDLEFMKAIDPNERSSHVHLGLNIDGKVKALGVLWDLQSDRFLYNLNIPTCSTITKRTILSFIQKLFDPLGWIAPFIVLTKILIQNLWLENIGWDVEVKPILKEQWQKISADLKNITKIKIDRWLGTVCAERESIQLHGFSDASNSAYSATVYCRAIIPDGTVKTTLIAAKTRVAPLKVISLPRLELCGALILSRLLRQVSNAMRVSASNVYAWTDSSIVLAWLSGEPSRWKPFVANRVVEILGNVSNIQWNHVASKENPADVASRGMFLDELTAYDLWWSGPEWLSKKDLLIKKINIIPTNIEMKKDKINTFNIIEGELKLVEKFINFDTLVELLNTIANCIRFLNFKRKEIIGSITPEELKHALYICIRLTQRIEFEEEIERLKGKKQVKRNSKLKSLNPFLDADDILRVGGRLRHANIDEQAKHPIILGNKNSFVSLIVADAHSQTLHGGIQLMLGYLRSQYWIIRAKDIVKKCLHHCLTCAKQRATNRSQVMGDLPKQRVTPSRPFSHAGVDFTGPFHILMTRYRGAKTIKAYISIFICMATKAIHLELVGDLTSEAFIGAFKRFCSRRGKCSHLWSDQGRNFIGANKDLIAAWKEANLEFTGSIAKMLASDGTHWHFIPPYSPNFGGLWEAGVKSVKYHLKRILTTNLTFEELSTVLCQIEACLNSRPLVPIDSDPEKIEILTPGHFLIGEAPIVVPSPSLKSLKINYLSRWQYTQRLLHDFWQRWQSEYLSRLQQRPKWLKREKEFEVGDIVLIRSENLPPGKWSLGRVVNKHPGPDGLTRVYSIKSGDSVVKRCVSKLCALPIYKDD